LFADYANLQTALGEAAPLGELSPPGYEKDAVGLLLLDRTETMLLFIQKANTEGYRWRAQVAFPGGRIDAADRDAPGAALRELEEELGINRQNVDVLGTVGHFQTRTSKNDLEVIVGRWRKPSPVRVDPREVARVIEVSLLQLAGLHIDRGFFHEPADTIGEALVYPVEGVNIWGVTARILHGFLDLAIDGNVLPRSRAVPRLPFRYC
jgi:coenzyme A diphosphatase NUDT7